MKTHKREQQTFGLMIGVLAGAVVGGAVAMWLAPRVRTRVVDTVDELMQKGQGVRDDLADAVGRAARQVERHATAAKSGRVSTARKHVAAERPATRRAAL